MEETVKFKVQSDVKDFETGFDRAWRAVVGFSDKSHKALAKFDKQVTASAGKFSNSADAFGKVNDTLARSAGVAGINAAAFRAMGDAGDLATLSMTGLTKSTKLMSVAGLGAVASAGALGYAAGTLIRKIPGVAEAVDGWAAALNRLVTSQEELDKQAGAMHNFKAWQEQMKESNAAAKQQQFAGMLAGGASPEDLKVAFGFSKAKDPMLAQIEAVEAKLGKQKEAAERWAESQKQAVEKVMAAWRKWQEQLDEIEADFRSMATSAFGTPSTVGGGSMAMYGLGKMPGEGSLAGMDNVLPPGVTREQMMIAEARQAKLDAGFSKESQNKAAGLTAGAGFGATFEEGFRATIKDLPGVVLAAFQGGGNIGKSIGASLGGGLSQSLATAAGPALGKMFGKTVGGALGSAIPVVGTLLGGAIGGLFGGLFGGGKSKEQKEAERKQAEEMRARIQGMAAASRAQSIDALGGAASAFFAGNSIVTEEDAKRSGTLFIDAWTQVVKTKGVLAAADAFGGAFDKMKADIEKQGIAMPDWMRFVEGQMGLSKNEGFRAAATQSQNAASFLGALGGSGGLSPESFRAFEQEARAQFAAAEGAAAEAGQSSADATKAGFAATNPLLKGLLNESMITGQTLSADIQKLIEQAGIVPDVDIQQLGELRQIRAAVQALAGGGALPGPAAGGPGGRADFGGEDRYPAFASGGDVTRTGLALVHQGERVLSKADVQAGGVSMKNYITVQASGNRVTDDEMVHKIGVTLANLMRRGRAAHLTSALKDDGFARIGKR